MPGQAKPKLQEAYDLSRTTKQLYDEATKKYVEEMDSGLPPHLRKGAQKVVDEVMDAHTRNTGQHIKLYATTVRRRYNGQCSIQDFNATKSWLNAEEREQILTYLTLMSSRGFPLTHRRLREVINSIIRNRIPDFPGVGKNYTDRFLKAHADRISSYWSSPLDGTRARAVNVHTINAWFDLLEQIITEYDIDPENIWGADETGVALGVGQVERVIGVSGKKNQYRQRSGGRENVTVMVTIGASGKSIPPLVIFRGQHFLVRWLQDNPLDAVLGYSKKGWMTGEISLEWIKHFDLHTKEQARGATRLLLVDGHVSHYTLELLDYARDHNIVMLCYPAHSTHVFQGLDVACFGKLKKLYSQYAGEYEDRTKQPITKDVFLTPFSQAYIETFTPETIRSAFSSTGVHPFNRGILTSDALAPSLPTSVHSGLPVVLPEEVSLLAGIWDAAPNRVPSPEWDIEAGDADVEMENGEGEGLGDVEAGVVENMVEPARHHPLVSALAATSASFLVGDSRITSHDELEHLPFYHLPPAPVVPLNPEEPQTEVEAELYRLVEVMRKREELITAAYRGAQARLVLADRHCSLLQGQLNSKESTEIARRENKGKARLMGDNMPKVLTQGEFYDRSVENRQIQVAEEEAKRQRQEKNAEKKRVLNDWKEREQARIAADKEARRLWKEGPLAEWEAENAACKAQGHRPRWAKPKPPQRTKPIPKPCVAEETVEEQDVGEQEGRDSERGEEGDSSGGEDEGVGDGSDSE